MLQSAFYNVRVIEITMFKNLSNIQLEILQVSYAIGSCSLGIDYNCGIMLQESEIYYASTNKLQSC
jgi:hypothetical protein